VLAGWVLDPSRIRWRMLADALQLNTEALPET
jgi:hypothetical protein